MIRTIAISLLLATLLAGCRSAREQGPLSKPRVVPRVSHFFGTPLSGPQEPEKDVLSSGPKRFIDCTLFALEDLPENRLDPLTAHTRLVALSEGETATAPEARFFSGSRAGLLAEAPWILDELEQGDLGRFSSLGRIHGGSFPGVTTRFQWEETGDVRGGRSPDIRTKRVEVLCLSGQDDAMRLALVMEKPLFISWDTPERETESNGGEDGKRPAQDTVNHDASLLVSQRETVILDESLDPGRHPLILFIPSPFDSSSARALAVLVESGSWINESDPEAEGPTLEIPKESSKDRDDKAVPVESTPQAGRWPQDPWPVIGEMIPGLESAYACRQTLGYLAQQTGAMMAADLALTAADPLVKTVAQAVLTASREAPNQNHAALGWIIESCAYQALLEIQKESELAPELEAV
ncbi:MAG: hypothetical protein KJ645_03770, partial [Planctomycetes bacterium]|nr:hypothetical protein [Planctomycetota bacterium]